MHRVVPAKHEPFSEVPGHLDVAGIKRLAMLDNAAVEGRSFHIAAHVVTPGTPAFDGTFRYTSPHAHDFDEVNVLVSESGAMTYAYEVDGRRFTVDAPATVFIGAGSEHRMEAISGSGVFLCIHLDARKAGA